MTGNLLDGPQVLGGFFFLPISLLVSLKKQRKKLDFAAPESQKKEYKGDSEVALMVSFNFKAALCQGCTLHIKL